MEKQIEEIIDSCYDEETTIDKNGNIEGSRLTLNKEKLIKAISELFKGMYPEEFIDYCIEAVNLEEREEVDYCYAVWYKGDIIGFDTLPELYQFWIDEFKDK